MERDSLVRPTEMIRPVKVDYLQSWSRTFWSDQTEIVRSIWCTNRNVRILGWMENALGCMVLCWVVVWRIDCFVKQPLVLLAITMWREKVGQNPCPYACLCQTSKFHHQGSLFCEQLSLHLLSLCMRILFKSIGHFRVPRTLTFKMRLSAQPFLWKWVLFAWE